jgi:hypothetical protein
VVGVKRVSFSSRFVNETKNDLIPGKIHTIRQNYDFWKKFEGRDVALFTWEGKPYRSKQRVFCVKRIVQATRIDIGTNRLGERAFWFRPSVVCWMKADDALIAKNDGFKTKEEMFLWFADYPDSEMAILHFTEFRY